jgi:hypothetical protein
VKKAYFSPVTSLLMSLSLALGILVSDLSGYRLLTRVHAQEGARCAGRPVVSDAVVVEDGLILSGITVRNVNVNGTFLEQAVIVGSVHLVNALVEGSTSVIHADGVIVGSDAQCANGVIVGSDVASPSGVIVGSDRPTPNGVIVGSDRPALSGVSGEATGTAVGGTLTGDDIAITDGFITGQNLLLSGATIDQGSISGSITSISVRPAN